MKLLQKPFSILIIFIVISMLLLAIQYLIGFIFKATLSYKIHFLLFFLSLIVITTSAILYKNHQDKIGFVFLGFVVFKIFAIGYLAVFEKEFKENLMYYFGIFWIYLTVEAILVVSLLPKQDNNHKNLGG